MVFRNEILSLNTNFEVTRESGTNILTMLGGTRLVLSRGNCSYTWIRRENGIRPEQSLKRAYLLALEKSPFDKTGVFLKSLPNGIAIWSWDANRVEESCNYANILCVPETAQIGDLEDGFYIKDCIDGVEGLYVHGDEIVLSRWWPSIPTEDNWARFTFNAEQFGAEFNDLPEPVKLSFEQYIHRTPKNQLPAPELLKMSSRGRLAMAAIFICLLITFYPIGRWVHLSAESQLVKREISALSSNFDSQLAIIRERTEIAAEIAKISGATIQRSPLVQFTEAVNLIVSKGGIIDRVEYTDDVWEISFRTSAEFSETDLVRIMEDSVHLNAVTIEADRRDNSWIAKFSDATQS